MPSLRSSTQVYWSSSGPSKSPRCPRTGMQRRSGFPRAPPALDAATPTRAKGKKTLDETWQHPQCKAPVFWLFCPALGQNMSATVTFLTGQSLRGPRSEFGEQERLGAGGSSRSAGRAGESSGPQAPSATASGTGQAREGQAWLRPLQGISGTLGRPGTGGWRGRASIS